MRNTVTLIDASEALLKYGYVIRWKDSNAHIIDVGCGDGKVTSTVLYPYVKNRIEKLTAVDISLDLIDLAKKETKIPNIAYQVMDIMDDEQVEKLKEKFDHIFSFYLGHWILDQRAFAANLYKMLKPHGQIFVAHVSNSPLHDSFHRHFREGTWSRYLPQEEIFLDYTDDSVGYIRKIVEEAGFKVEVCENEKKLISLENYADFIRSIVSLYKHMDRLPDKLREVYLQDHVKYCLEKSTRLDKSNAYKMPYETLTCIASK